MEKRKDSSDFFRALAEEAITAILVFDSETQECVFCNAMAREILELQVAGDGCGNSLKAEDLFVSKARGGLRPMSAETLRHEGLAQDVLVRKSNDTTFIANVGIKKIRMESGDTVLLVMLQDITFQKKLQREIMLKQDEIHKAYSELLEQNRQLKELDLAKDQFIALTTHELRTPLSAIVATAEVLHLKMYESEEQRENFIKTVYEQGLHLAELVNDVLDFAKIRAGKMEFYVEFADIRPVSEKIFEGFRNLASASDVDLFLEPRTEPALCYFDLVRFKEIFANVVSNAIKYNRRGGSVRVSIECGSEFTRVSVADTGQGIPADKIVNVFNEFETVGKVSRHHRGTGLGMPISKRLAEAMGGRLILESVVDVGTTFFIDIPNHKVLPEELYRSRPGACDDLVA